MKKALLLVFLFSTFSYSKTFAQVPQQNYICSTPNLDSATAVALPYYDNNQILEQYLDQQGYNNLKIISFPSSPIARSTIISFPEPKFLIPMNLYIYRNATNDPASSISEDHARDYICRVNEIYRDAGTAIQFYVNHIEMVANDFFHNKISTSGHVYDMFSSQRISEDKPKGINIHFIRNNQAPEGSGGKASLPHYPMAPYTAYSLYIRTHQNRKSKKMHHPVKVAGTLSHEIGHVLGLLHTHHPGRLPSLAANEENGTIMNDCYQESVSRDKTNRKKNGCLSTHRKRKCEINGDFLCDTDADPGQSRRIKKCSYIYPARGDFKVDNWNKQWHPPVNNVMSYSNDKCRTSFSRGQIGIMWMQMQEVLDFMDHQAPSVSEQEMICFGSSTEISLHNFPEEASVSWEVEPSNMLRTSKGKGSLARLKAATPSSGGTATLTFTITGPGNCYIATVKKLIQIESLSSSQVEVEGTQEVCGGNQYVYTAYPYEPGFTYNWKFPGNWTKASQSGNQITLQTPSYSTPTGGVVEVSVSNGCGASPYSGITVYPLESCSSFSFTTYPNPTKEVLTIEQVTGQEQRAVSDRISLNQSLKKSSVEENFKIKLYNSNKKEVALARAKNKKVSLDIRNLPEGIYYLHIYDGKQVLQKQIVVEK